MCSLVNKYNGVKIQQCVIVNNRDSLGKVLSV